MQSALDMTVSGLAFERLADGSKTVEGRKNSPTWSPVLPGHLLRIIKTEEPSRFFYARVLAVRVYEGPDPLLAYLLAEGLTRILPGIAQTLSQAIFLYQGWLGAAEIDRLGMRALELQRL